MKISFTIPCNPPTATSQQKGAFKTSAGIRFFKKKNVLLAENSLMALLYPHKPERPLEGPLRLHVEWKFPWRVSEPKKNRTSGSKYCDTRPDLSNIIKLIEDVMTTLRFWHDDGQISVLHLTKAWDDLPGITIEAEELNFTPNLTALIQ